MPRLRPCNTRMPKVFDSERGMETSDSARPTERHAMRWPVARGRCWHGQWECRAGSGRTLLLHLSLTSVDLDAVENRVLHFRLQLDDHVGTCRGHHELFLHGLQVPTLGRQVHIGVLHRTPRVTPPGARGQSVAVLSRVTWTPDPMTGTALRRKGKSGGAPEHCRSQTRQTRACRPGRTPSLQSAARHAAGSLG